jgi:hypothetical protein
MNPETTKGTAINATITPERLCKADPLASGLPPTLTLIVFF